MTDRTPAPGMATIQRANNAYQRWHNFFVRTIGLPVFLAGAFVLALGQDPDLGVVLMIVGSILLGIWWLATWRERRRPAE